MILTELDGNVIIGFGQFGLILVFHSGGSRGAASYAAFSMWRYGIHIVDPEMFHFFRLFFGIFDMIPDKFSWNDILQLSYNLNIKIGLF